MKFWWAFFLPIFPDNTFGFWFASICLLIGVPICTNSMGLRSAYMIFIFTTKENDGFFLMVPSHLLASRLARCLLFILFKNALFLRFRLLRNMLNNRNRGHRRNYFTCFLSLKSLGPIWIMKFQTFQKNVWRIGFVNKFLILFWVYWYLLLLSLTSQL